MSLLCTLMTPVWHSYVVLQPKQRHVQIETNKNGNSLLLKKMYYQVHHILSYLLKIGLETDIVKFRS